MDRLNLDPATATLLEVALRLLTIAVLALLATRALRLIDRRLVVWLVARRRGAPADPAREREAQQKAKTLAGLIGGFGYALILVIAVSMALRELGFDVTLLLASAGVVGIAIGFGAQTLVRDLLSGFFIIFEDQFAVDDIVRVGEFGGQVERLTPRITQIRTLDGALITIPNGEIKAVVNQSKQWSGVNLDVQVPNEADLDAAIELLREVGRDLQEDPQWGPVILETPQVLGIEQLGQTSVTVKVLVKTQPTRQFEVGRELRRRIKQAFREAGIDQAVAQSLQVTGPAGRDDALGRQTLIAQAQSEAERAPAARQG
jgi:small conductance mechanosensitive channel